ncbi:MAG: transmembrane-type terpene cyclase, partial [Bacteroidia bacterium]
LNTATYTVPELVLFGIGAFFWILCYIFVIKGIIKYKFVGISASVVGANFAWEFLWAFVYRQDMGEAIQIGYYGWFALDVFIVFSMFRYGYKQALPQNQKYFRSFFAYSILAWGFVLYYFIKDGADNAIGANSAYAIQLLISASCLGMMLRAPFEKGISYIAAWSRTLGSLFCGIMCIMHWPNNHWILSMVIAYMVIDIFYLFIATKNLKVNGLT